MKELIKETKYNQTILFKQGIVNANKNNTIQLIKLELYH